MEAKQFKDFLKVAKKYNKGNKIAILDNLLFSGDSVTLYEAENDRQTRLVIDSRFDDPFLIPLTNFDKIISKLGANGTVDFTVSGENVVLNTNKGTFTFEMEDKPGDYHTIVGDFEHQTSLTQGEVAAIKRLSAYTVDDDLRPVMANVLVDKYNIVASDSYKMVYPESQQQRKDRFLVHRDIAANLLPGVIDVDMWQKGRYDNYIRLSQPDTGIEITYKEEEGKYPEWPNILPQDKPITTMYVKARDVLDALGVGSINQNAAGRFVFETLDSKVQISTEDVDFKTGYHNTIPAHIDGENINIGFKSEFLSKILKTEKLEDLTIEMTEPHRGAVINGYILLMPMMNG